MIDITEKDCIVVGAGFCGSVVARKMAEAGQKVLMLERRNHIAGNMYDEVDANGILVHRYGPHVFHTTEKKVFDFVAKYGEWIDYQHRGAADMEGVITPLPVNFKTIDLLYERNEAEALKANLKNHYKELKSVTILELLECADITIVKFAEKLLELNYRPYTIKQWGLSPDEIDPSVLNRVPVRLDYTDAYFDDEYQALPKNGYTEFFKMLLDHENIEVRLNIDALEMLKADTKGKKLLFNNKPVTIPVVYTGAIDELMEYRYGLLPYRSLIFDYHTKNVDSFQEAPVVVHPGARGYTRITEYKKMMLKTIPNVTTIVYEYPVSADKEYIKEQYYPILTNTNMLLYNKYYSDLIEIPNLFLCGRLADFKYYNMDTVILRAFNIFKELYKNND